MRRREFVTLLGAAAIVRPPDSIAEPAAKTYRLGTLTDAQCEQPGWHDSAKRAGPARVHARKEPRLRCARRRRRTLKNSAANTGFQRERCRCDGDRRLPGGTSCEARRHSHRDRLW